MPTDTTGYPPEFAALLDNYNQEVTVLMARLEAGKVTSAAWTEEMQRILSRYSQAARMLGMGEVKLLPAEVDAVRAWLNEQFKYLNGFETVINSAGGEYDPAWLPRAQMYGASTVTEYWEGRTSGLPLPAMPGQQTQCLSNCRCRWEIQWLDKKAGDADAYWMLGNVEADRHCQTCLTRAEMWSPVRIRNGDLQP